MVIIDYLSRLTERLYEKFTRFLYSTYVEDSTLLLKSIAISFAIVSVVWLIELYYVGWKKSGMRQVLVAPTRSTINDIVFFLIHISGAVLILSWVASLGLPVIVRSMIRDAFNLELGSYMAPIIHLGLYLFVLDFFSYWQHRIMHRYPTLWQIHSFHHSAMEFNTITVLREHPLDKAIGAIVSIIPAVLLGVPVQDYPIFISIYGAIGYFKHSRIPWRLGWFGKYVVQSPIDHWIHHSNQAHHYDTNFSNVFAMWDHVFGTYYKGKDINDEIGLAAAPFNQKGWMYDMVKVQLLFMQHLFRWPFNKPPTLQPRESQQSF